MQGMQSIQVDVGPGILGRIGGIFYALLAGRLGIVIFATAGVALVTYSMLNMFMKKSLFLLHHRKMDTQERGTLFASLLVVAGTLLPLVKAVVLMFDPSAGLGKSAWGLMLSIIIAAALCWIFSAYFKRFLLEPTDKQFLFFEALESLGYIASRHLANWLARIGMGLVNLGIRTIHVPYILNYSILAVLLNLVLSAYLIGIIGISKEMGSANIFGSLIGGVLHYWIKRKEIKELSTKYKAWAERSHKKHKQSKKQWKQKLGSSQ